MNELDELSKQLHKAAESAQSIAHQALGVGAAAAEAGITRPMSGIGAQVSLGTSQATVKRTGRNRVIAGDLPQQLDPAKIAHRMAEVMADLGAKAVHGK